MAFLQRRDLHLYKQIIALALNEGRPTEVHHKTIGAASLSLSERFQMGLGKLNPQSVVDSVHLNPERFQPGQCIEGHFIPDGALLQTAESPLNAVPLETFSTEIGLTLKSHLPDQ